MPRGRDLDRNLKELLHEHIIVKKRSPDNIFANVFNSNKSIISVHAIRKIKTLLFKMDSAQRLIWLTDTRLEVKNKRTGRPLKFKDDVRQYVKNTNKIHTQMKIRSIRKTVQEEFYSPANRQNAPSRRTCHRIIADDNKTRKKVEYRHINRDFNKELNYFRSIEHIPVEQWIDTDEIKSNNTDFLNTMGRSDKGTRCVIPQLQINGIFFSVFASMTEEGFECWEINDHIHTAEDFIHYLDNTLVNHVAPNKVGMFDNCSLHKTHEAVIFGGRYTFCPQYSPHLKPIELGFSLIRRWLEEHDDLCQRKPREALETAFFLFSNLGPYGYKIKNLWRQYKRNYQFFLNSI